uniref:Uncharacterized protein n=1 Tax=Anguilla anguilla TaxID=7936 RepID=A0A0E9PRR0_ANGAN
MIYFNVRFTAFNNTVGLHIICSCRKNTMC